MSVGLNFSEMRNLLIRNHIRSLLVTTGSDGQNERPISEVYHPSTFRNEISNNFWEIARNNKIHDFKSHTHTHAHAGKHIQTDLELQFCIFYTLHSKYINDIKKNNKENYKFLLIFITFSDDRKHYLDVFSYQSQRFCTVYILWKIHISIWGECDKKKWIK